MRQPVVTAGAMIAALLVAALLMAAPVPAVAKDYDPAHFVDHTPFDELLARYAAPGGVRYAAWKANEADRRKLDDYVASLAAAAPSELTRYRRLAFWLNAYNALTVKLILDHYPVKSIKDIGSPWDRKVITVEGEEVSLNQIEHEIIRKQWKEPRIHFALNCASISCPPLRAGAYHGPTLDTELQEQTEAFLADRSTNYVDDRGRLHLSKIFRWYRDDFEPDGGKLAAWVRPYFPELQAMDAAALKKVDIKFAGYDWDLNEAAE